MSYTIKKRKFWGIIAFASFGIVLFYSYATSPYLASIPFFAHAQEGLGIFQGYPTYANGRLWRVNQTGYILKTSGETVSIVSQIPIGNFSECYAVSVLVKFAGWIKINETAIPNLNESECFGF